MKNLLLIIALIGMVFHAKADQLAYLSKKDADKAVDFLKSREYVILYCACCSDDFVKYYYYTDVYSRHTGYEDYYEVILSSIDWEDQIVEKPVDLAYVHIEKDDGLAYCLGLELGMDCDPCTEPFSLAIDDYDEGEYIEDYGDMPIFLSEEQIEEIRELLSKNEGVFYEYCSCCEEEIPHKKLTFVNIDVFPADDVAPGYSEILIITKAEDGEEYLLFPDNLQSVYIIENKKKAMNATKFLDFDWPSFSACEDELRLK